MGFWIAMGGIVGAILGAMGGGLAAALVLGLLGAGLGALVGRAQARSATLADVPPSPAYGDRASATTPSMPATRQQTAADFASAVLRRLDDIDTRLARIEASITSERAMPHPESPAPDVTAQARTVEPLQPGVEASAAASPVAATRSVQTIDVPAGPKAAPVPEATVRAADGTLQKAAHEAGVPATPLPELERHEGAAAPAVSDTPPPRPAYVVAGSSADGDAPAREPSLLWRWISGGNAVTRVGIVILFFGVAFLLRYFAEIVTVPIELKLLAAGAGGVALAAIGLVLARRRPAYGLSLQGAGMGIVYLVVFAAFRLYAVLSPPPAIALLVVAAVATVGMALRHDSQPLAALALAGGFLAPVLIRTGSANAALLFGYFAVLNAAIFALAWRRAWRPLNVLGFVFTFALGLLWGYEYYTPRHYAIVQPYLALFFAFYVGIAILYARRGPLDTKAPVDGVLVFGVPIVGFALQMAIVRSHRYGVAWSAAALAVFYGVLWFALRGAAQAGVALLAKAFAALALIFATLAIPFAVDPRATSAWWALEAAGVYVLGVLQRQPLARAFALLLQLGAAVAFLSDRGGDAGTLLLNARFLGMTLIGLAAFACVWAADRNADRIGPRERALLPWLVGWGALWWVGGGIDEMLRQIRTPGRIDAALAWVTFTSALALTLSRVLRWPRIAWVALLQLPAMAAAGIEDLRETRTSLTHFGWIVWPIAWVVQWAALRAAESLREATATVQRLAREDELRIVHAVSTIALVAWASWELGEWAGRWTPPGSAWRASVVVIPSLLFLFAAAKERDRGRWPFATHGAAYGLTAGTTIATLAFAWIAIVNFESTGDASPLPYVPLLNPLDLTLVAALGALAEWDRVWGRHDARARYGWLGAAAFLALNGAVVRTAHHWGDVAWRFDALLAYKPLQAALTLTWTVTSLALMVYATRRGVRALWLVGAALLAVVVVKLFAVDLAALSGLTRVVAFMGVGLLLLVIGYVTPLPPAVGSPVAEDALPRS